MIDVSTHIFHTFTLSKATLVFDRNEDIYLLKDRVLGSVVLLNICVLSLIFNNTSVVDPTFLYESS